MSGYFQREAEENEEREEYRDALERNYRELERAYTALKAERDTLRERCEKLETQRDDVMKSEHDFRNEAQEVYTDRYIQHKRAEAAEARIRELEKVWAFVAGDIVEMNSCEGMHRLLAAVGLTWPGEITIDPTSPIVWEQKCKEAETRIVELKAKIEELDGYAKGIVDMILSTTETESETPEDGWSISALEYELDEWCAWKIKEHGQELKIEHHKDCPCNIIESWECKCGNKSIRICDKCKHFGFSRIGINGNCWKNGDNMQPIRMPMYSTCSMWSPKEKYGKEVPLSKQLIDACQKTRALNALDNIKLNWPSHLGAQDIWAVEEFICDLLNSLAEARKN